MIGQMISKKPYVIANIDATTPWVTVFTFKSADGSTLDFEPGMFGMLTYRDPVTGAETTRAFSFASMPGTDTVEFTISMIHGRFTSHLDDAKIGDVYYLTGPYGQFKFDRSKAKILCIAGGTGIAPFLSMFREKKRDGLLVDCTLIYSVKYPKDIIRETELRQLHKDIGVNTVVTVTRPNELPEPWSGETGHIDSKMIAKYVGDVAGRKCYICGPLAFVKAIKAALKELSVKDEDVKADVWG